MSPPIVLLHGAGGNAASFGPTLDAWGGADVRALDLPGRSGSTRPARTADEAAARMAPDLLAMGRPVVVGHSYGGAVALSLALDHAHAIAGIVLVASGGRLRVAPSILEAVAASAQGDAFRLDFAFGPGTSSAVIERYAADTAWTPPATALADWQACDAFDVLGRLGEIGRPTLVVHGDADRLTPPKHQVRLAEAIPGARRIELPGLGHMLPWESPGALAEAVLSFAAACPHCHRAHAPMCGSTTGRVPGQPSGVP